MEQNGRGGGGGGRERELGKKEINGKTDKDTGRSGFCLGNTSWASFLLLSLGS